MTFHSDDVTIGAWTTKAWDSAGRPGRLLYATTTHEHIAAYSTFYEEWGVYMTDERPFGHPASDLAVQYIMGGDLLDQKLAALAAMASQTAGAIADPLIPTCGRPRTVRSASSTPGGCWPSTTNSRDVPLNERPNQRDVTN